MGAKQQRDAKEELVNFLDRKCFEPVLRASPDKYGEADRRKLEDVQRSTESEQKRFRENYGSASEVRMRYLDDLTSEAAKKKNAELQQLKLPRLPDVKDEFLQLCERLGVK